MNTPKSFDLDALYTYISFLWFGEETEREKLSHRRSDFFSAKSNGHPLLRIVSTFTYYPQNTNILAHQFIHRYIEERRIDISHEFLSLLNMFAR